MSIDESLKERIKGQTEQGVSENLFVENIEGLDIVLTRVKEESQKEKIISSLMAFAENKGWNGDFDSLDNELMADIKNKAKEIIDKPADERIIKEAEEAIDKGLTEEEVERDKEAIPETPER